MAIPLGLILGAAGASALPSIFAGFDAKKQYDEHAKLLGGMSLDIPQELNVVSEILRQRRGQDMPGYDSMKRDIMDTIPATMEQVKKASTSPSTLLSALGSIQQGASTNINQLNIHNAMQKLAADESYTNFLSGVMAPMKTQAQMYGNQAKIAASESGMMGRQQMWQGITGGIDSAVNVGTSLAGLGFQQQQLKTYQDYWGPGGGGFGNQQVPPMDTSKVWSGGGLFG